MSKQLNEQQAIAVAEFDRDLLVSAGAGTGKTSVLTSKYLRLLEEHRAEVKEVVAITFTKKAAAEMQDRIQEKIVEHQKTAEAEEIEYWRIQFEHLNNARICTFHSFCLRLIKERPLEAGVTPATRILGDGEESIYLNQAIEHALLKLFEGQFSNESILAGMLLEAGWEGFVDQIGQLYRNIRESGIGFDQTCHMTQELLTKALQQTIVESSCLIDELSELLKFAQTQKLTAHAGEVIGELGAKWVDYQAVLNSPAGIAQIPTLRELRKALPKNLPAVLKIRVVAIHKLIEELTTKLLDQEALQRLPVLQELLQGIEREYTRLKLELGVLDFTDQLLLARDLLVNYPEIAALIRSGIKYLLVDEFQDTNQLQMELVNLLAGTGYQGGRVMVVGDVKQSIYRFRGADAGLIKELAQKLSGTDGRIIPLTQNYRSEERLISFVNLIAAPMFQNEGFNYEALEAARGNDNSGVEFLLVGKKDRKLEATLIATRIKLLVTEEEWRYGDIVLLFRASTAMSIYQQALQEAGIPYFTASGGGFYHCLEVVDQLNLLRVVQQRYDGVALLALLTSPYVGLTNESLLCLGKGRDLVERFYELTDLGTGISEAEQERLFSLRELLNYLQANREYLSIPDLLRIALERCRYWEVLWTLNNAAQKVANLEKLLNKADEFASRGFHDLHRFLAYIAQLEEVEVIEGEAQTQAEASNAVRLMTIHRAKGLEFPVVFLPDLDRNFNFSLRERLAFHPQLGMAFAIPIEGETGEPSIWKKYKEVNRREEVSEAKRVLYVAMTRAKQRLILAGSGKAPSSSEELELASNWMKWFELLLPLKEAETELNCGGVQMKITRELPILAQPRVTKTLLELYGSRLSEITTSSVRLAQIEVAATALPKVWQRALRVSEVLCFKECPRRYYWEYLLKLKEMPGSNFGSGSGDNLGGRIGSFIHQVVRVESDKWPDSLWEKAFGDLASSTMERLKRELIKIWDNFQKSEFTRRDGEIWDEIPFLIEISDNLRIEGRFDRLLKQPNGDLVLVDYKTHRITAEKAIELAPEYFWQLQLYALAVEKLWGCLPKKAVLYFPYPDQAIEVPLGQDDLAQTVGELEKIAKFLQAEHQWSDYPARTNCDHCGYFWFCNQG